MCGSWLEGSAGADTGITGSYLSPPYSHSETEKQATPKGNPKSHTEMLSDVPMQALHSLSDIQIRTTE